VAEYEIVTGTEASEIVGGTSAKRTILTTDIVGSTALSRRYPNDMMNAMDLHDRVPARRRPPPRRRPLPLYRRRRARDFSTGRSMAVDGRDRGATRDAPHRLGARTGRLQVRFGIHTGLTRAARARAISSARLLPTANPAAERRQRRSNPAVGRHGAAARGRPFCRQPFQLSDPRRAPFQGHRTDQGAPGLGDRPAETRFPADRGEKREKTASGNLPANLSSFLGRERELDELAQVSLGSRMLTLVGPGGIGKTRLAIEFCPLAGSDLPRWRMAGRSLHAGNATARFGPVPRRGALDPAGPGPPSRGFKCSKRLRDTRAILVLDNCEHVLDPIGGRGHRARARPAANCS